MGFQKKKNCNSVIGECLQQKDKSRSILYIRHLSQLTDNINAGLLLSQLLYWHGKGIKKEWTFKTIQELRDETGLTKNQQAKAIDIWKKVGFLEVKLVGIPPKRHFKVNLDILLDFLEIREMFYEKWED